MPFDLRRWFAPAKRMLDLQDRTVFITGGSRGLGLEIARVCGARGARVGFCGRDADEVERARGDLVRRGHTVFAGVADVRSEDDIRRVLREAQTQLGPIDVLVNNAGTIQVGPLDAVTLDDYRDAMATHFWAALEAIDAVVPGMRERRRGRIVNIASIGGRVSVPHLLPYSASKFALVGLSEGLRAELIRYRVYVTTVVPGLMRTGSPERATFKGRNRLEYAWFSLGDSLPFVSVDVVEAAQAIVDAAQRGDAELTISAPAALLSLAHGIAPAAVVEVLGVVARLLPPFGGIGRSARPGYASHSAVAPSPLTASTQRRARSQNEEPV